MALAATCVWQIEAGGDANAGGAFDPVSGTPGTDYTYGAGQALTTWLPAAGTYTNDLAATDASPSVLSSASYNFVAADVGNVINLTAGTNLTTGRYQIMSVAANVATLDRNCSSGGAVSATSGYLGGACTLVDAVLEARVADNVCWVDSDAAHTLAANLALGTVGATSAPVVMIGYTGDRVEATGDDRPLVDCGTSYNVSLGAYEHWRNFRFIGEVTKTVDCGNLCVIENCDIRNDSGSSGRIALFAATGCAIVNCDIRSDNGYAISMDGSANQFVRCYIHGSDYGINIWKASTKFIHNVVDTCVVGVILDASAQNVFGNTFYGCTTGLDCNIGTDYGVMMFNIFANNTTAVDPSTDVDGLLLVDYNNWWSNTDDISGAGSATKGPHALALDPTWNVLDWTDLACADHTGPTYTLTSATGGFNNLKAGDWLRITDTGTGGHFVEGTYTIYSISSDTSLELTADPTDGTNETAGDGQYRDFRPGPNMFISLDMGSGTTKSDFFTIGALPGRYTVTSVSGG